MIQWATVPWSICPTAMSSSYDVLDRLILRADTSGVLASYAYDADGNRIAETDANGNITRNTYDALNQLVEQVLPADRTRTFAYEQIYRDRQTWHGHDLHV
jgi:YD repeat-containing protein